jgi:hypothetical protein
MDTVTDECSTGEYVAYYGEFKCITAVWVELLYCGEG